MPSVTLEKNFTFLGSARPIATPGVEQNSPTLMPGVAKVDFSVATAISQLATNWQPAAVATPFTIAMTGTGRSWIRVMTFEKGTVIWLRWHTQFCTANDLWPLSRSGTPCCDTRGPGRRSAPWGRDPRKTRAPALQRETQSYCGRPCLNGSSLDSFWTFAWYDDDAQLWRVRVRHEVLSQRLQHGQRQSVPLPGVVQNDPPEIDTHTSDQVHSDRMIHESFEMIILNIKEWLTDQFLVSIYTRYLPDEI